MSEKKLQECQRILREKDLCVLATAGTQGAHCSLMGYALDDSETTVICITERNTLKYLNMQANPRVSLLVDTRDESPEHQKMQALTLGCLAQELTGTQREAALKRLATTQPQLAEILASPDAAVMALEIKSYQLLTGATDMFRHDVAAQ